MSWFEIAVTLILPPAALIAVALLLAHREKVRA
jgi:hypothetical protein